MKNIRLPEKGKSRDELMREMLEFRSSDADWRGAKTWGLVYNPGDEALEASKLAYMMYLSENALNPMAFPSVTRMENEVVGMAADLLGGGAEAAGNITTGGTESILLAVKSSRDRARSLRKIDRPEMLLPVSAHPAFMKAADYFDVTPVLFPISADFRADVEAARRLITDNTILIVGSAPCFPFGVVDPISDLAAMAAERDICCHVDACVGGMLLPFVRELGYAVPPFDFSVPGVTSISADLHKYGYTAKGASVIIYRNKGYRRHQYYAYADWPGGVYASPTMTGSRSGGPVAAAWALFHYFGREGYLKMTRQTMESTQKLIAGINSVPGLNVLGKPDMSLIFFGSDKVNVFMLGDALHERGWLLDKLLDPPALHMVVTVSHEKVAAKFLEELSEENTKLLAKGPAQPSGMAAIYGMIGTLPDKSAAKNMVIELLGNIYSLPDD